MFIWNNNLVNLGWTKANNEGIRYFINESFFDVAWLLNNDTQIPDIDAACKAMEEEFTKNPNTGIIGHKILSMEDKDFIHHAGTGRCLPSGEHKVGRVSLGQFEKRTREKWVTGASMAISAGCLLETGVMDDKMKNYYSDSDYCYSARYRGYDVVYLPIPIYHHIGQSAHPSEEQQKVMKADSLAFHSKWLIGKAFFDLDNEITD